MSVKTGLNKAHKLLGKVNLAKQLGISYQAIDRWYLQNRMPATEYNGRTQYSKKIQELTEGAVTIEDLCGFVPPPQAD
jgi:hypothetical protein